MASDEPTRVQPPLPLGKMINPYEHMAILQPKMAWKCELHTNTFWHVEEDKQPNAFHRFMQRLCFGVKWTRVDD